MLKGSVALSRTSTFKSLEHMHDNGKIKENILYLKSIRPYRLAYFFSIIALLTACQYIPNNTKPLINNFNDPKISTPFISIKGWIVIGHEISMISTCNGVKEYWLTLPDELIQQIEKLITKPYQPIYADVSGYLSAAPKDGFASDFSEVFNLIQVNTISSKTNDCHKPISAEIIFANKPF